MSNINLQKKQDIEKLENQLENVMVAKDFYLSGMKRTVLYKLYEEIGESERAKEVAVEFIHQCTRGNLLKLEEDDKLNDIMKELKKAHCYLGSKGEFYHFLIAMEFNREPSKRFFQPRMRQLKPVVDDLQDLFDGKIEFYELEMPPRVGKTTLGLFFLAMCVGCHPNKSSLTVSYATNLAGNFYDGVMELANDPEYNFREIFPDCPITDQSAKELWLDFKDKRRYKSITFRSIDGQITGGVEATDILYLDDLIQNAEEAKNEDRLAKAWDKVTIDIFQRCKKQEGCKILAIGTNWSINDPLTRLAEIYKDNPRARIRKLPALDPVTDESNFDFDYGVGFSTEDYRNLRDNVFKHDPVSFSCIYQQEPMERSELTFPIEELKRYIKLPNKKIDRTTAFIDCAFGGGDFLSMPICVQVDGEAYIVDWVWDNRDYKHTIPVCAEAIIKNNVGKVYVEANNGGKFYADDLKEYLKSVKYRCRIETVTPPTNLGKLERIERYVPDIMEMSFKDASILERGDSYSQALNNVVTFSAKSKNWQKHDDAPDSLAGLAEQIKRGISRVATVIKRSELPFF